jgi:transposase
VPTHERARQYLKEIRFHLRTPAEGLKPECTKPSRKKNRYNCGGSANVCAGIANGRIVMWEYLAKTWNGEEAAALYEGAIIKTLKKERGEKRKYFILEDNDPTGYKSNKAKSAKQSLHIETLEYPRYSPDLNPLDYSLWHEVERRTLESAPKTKETVDSYKERLWKTALGLPKAVVLKAVEALPKRARAVVDAGGDNIPRD